jgi:RNA polymerase sigma-70 factor (ECF subfamily)
MIMPVDPAESSHSVRTRSSLLFRLRDWQDAASWEEFYRLYQKLVYGLASRSGLTRVEAEEVTQDVFKRVAETIAEFESNPERGSFRGWLMNLTRWRIADKFRERQRAAQMLASPRPPVDDASHTRTIERVADQSILDTEAVWDSEWQQHLLEAALQRLKARVPARHFQIFDAYTRQNASVLQVARDMGVNPATVYVVTHRLTKQLKAEVALLEKQLR